MFGTERELESVPTRELVATAAEIAHELAIRSAPRIPNPATPEQEATCPRAAAPGTTDPDTASPHTAHPEAAAPEAIAPDTAGIRGAALGAAASGLAASGLAASGLAASGAAASGMAASGAAASGLAGLGESSASGAESLEMAELLARAIDLCEAALADLIRQVEASGEPARWGFPSTSAWLRSRLGMRDGRARERLNLARQLPRLPNTARRLATGALSAGYAATICEAVGRLNPADALAGEDILLGLADQAVPPGKAAVAGRRITDLIRQRDDTTDPPEDIRRGYERSWITTSRALDGGRYIKGYLGPEDAAVWDAALAPLAKPAGPHDPRDQAERTAAALTGILSAGHHTAHITVVMDLDTLTGSNTPARLVDGTPIPPQQARRLALAAGVSPLILGPRSRPLYYGYRRRFATTHQRRILETQYPTCAVDDCNIPAPQCEVDHVYGFALGHSPTDIDKLTLCCGWHNRFKTDHPDQIKIHTTPTGRYHYQILPPTTPRAGPTPHPLAS